MLGVEGEASSGLPGTREKAKMPTIYECILLALAIVNVAMTVAFYVTVLGLIKSLFGHR